MAKTIPLYAKAKTQGYVSLVSSLGDETTIVNAARVSFDREVKILTKSDQRLIEYLLKHKHTSTLEHNLITFKFKAPLFVARQHMRHRTWSFNEVSRRYTSENLEFYCPLTFREQAKSNRQSSVVGSGFNPILETIGGILMDYPSRADEDVRLHVKNSLTLYENMLKNGVCREQARMILPQNLYTTYIGTVNLNNLIKFLNLRDHEGAQQEIQELAQATRAIAEHVWPEIMSIISRNKQEAKTA